MTDYVLNGRGFGPVGKVLDSRAVGFDLGRLRPYMSEDGVPSITVNTGKFQRDDKAPDGVKPIYKRVSLEWMRRKGFDIPVGNASIMRREGYALMDQQLHEVARRRLRYAQALRNNNTFGGWDGMANERLDYEVISDFASAQVDMDGLTVGQTQGGPLIGLSSTPAPITHVDLTYSQRRIAVFSKMGPGLGQLGIRQAGLRIGESIEKVAIGVDTGISWGNVTTGPFPQRDQTGTQSKVYGAITHPKRITKTNMTTPTGSNPDAVFGDILAMISTMQDNFFYGPYTWFHSTDYSQYLNKYYAFTNGSNWAVSPSMSLRQAILGIDGVQDVVRLDWLTAASYPFTSFLQQMTPEVSRMAVGLPMTVLQWPSKGGLQQNWKALTIEFPQFIYDYNGVLPLLEGTTS